MTSAPATELVRFKNLLYATDFSQPSSAALPIAIAVARRYGATVYALHVLTPLGNFARRRVRLGAEAALAAMQEIDSQLAGLQHRGSVDHAPDVWSGVERAIHDCSIDLIVLGTHGRTGAQKLLLGSVAEQIFRRSACPVLTVGPRVQTDVRPTGRFSRILFATDHTLVSLAAAPHAVSLAEYNEARLVLLHVAPEIEVSKSDRRTEPSVAEMIQRLYDAVPWQVQLSTPPEVAIEYGRPAEQIVEAAARRSADLIVLGVRRIPPDLPEAPNVRRATAQEVVAHASCPVLTVRER
jgi:nucleotide-binding universal stress UspA family protein